MDHRWRTATLTGLLTFALPLSGCLLGLVEDATTGTPVADVTVRGIGRCAVGDCYEMSTVHSNGAGLWYFAEAVYDPAGPQPTTDEVYALLFTKAGTCGALHQVNPVYERITLGDGSEAWAAIAPTAMLSTDCADSDNDGLPDEEEARRGTDPSTNDTDGDGLDDFSEVRGSHWVDLPGLGADPLRKDVFVELDYVPFTSDDGSGNGSVAITRPTDDALALVVDAFAQAPVGNPDGSRGISLHIDVDDLITRAGADVLCAEDGGFESMGAELTDLRDEYRAPERIPFFRWALSTGNFCGADGNIRTNSGLASTPGNRFLVTMGSKFDAGDSQAKIDRMTAGTFMHELGHNLGLGHAGTNLIGAPRGKPNNLPHYFSVMNYTYQMHGVVRDGQQVIDYARFATDGLDEGALSEEQGVDSPYAPDSELARYTVRARIGAAIVDNELRQWSETLDASGCTPEDSSGPGQAAPTPGADSMVDWTFDCSILLDPARPPRDLDGDLNISVLPAARADWPSLDFYARGAMSAGDGPSFSVEHATVYLDQWWQGEHVEPRALIHGPSRTAELVQRTSEEEQEAVLEAVVGRASEDTHRLTRLNDATLAELALSSLEEAVSPARRLRALLPTRVDEPDEQEPTLCD